MNVVLSKVLHFVERMAIACELRFEAIFQCKNELIIEAGCLMWGIRVVILEKFRFAILNKLCIHQLYW